MSAAGVRVVEFGSKPLRHRHRLGTLGPAWVTELRLRSDETHSQSATRQGRFYVGAGARRAPPPDSLVPLRFKS